MTIRCYACGKPFDLVLAGKDSQKHPCPACGQAHFFDPGAFEKKAVEHTRKMIKKTIGS